MSWSRRVAATAATLSLLVAGQAAADRKVFINGVDLADTSVAGQTFESCRVTFDKDGNVHITAPGLDVRRTPVATRPPPVGAEVGMEEASPTADVSGTPASGRYFLVSRQRLRGAVQYDVDVFVNGKLVKTVRSDRDPVILEITGNVRRGPNLVRMVASKNLGPSDKRASFSPTDVLEVIIGEGTVADGTVTVHKSLVEYRRNASETRRYSDQLQFTAK